MMSQSSEKRQFKVCLLGEHAVGKTQIMKFLMQKGYSESYELDFGINFASLPVEINENRIELELWDIAAQNKYGSLWRVFYKDADYFIFLFDINTESLQNIEQWLERVKHIIKEPSIALMRTKIDLPENDLSEERKKELEKIKTFAEKNSYSYFEVSAKEKRNISEAFNTIGNLLLEKANTTVVPVIVPQKEIDVINNEITRLWDNQGLFHSSSSDKIKQLRILRNMLSSRADKPVAELVEEWKTGYVEVKGFFGSTKMITRDDLMKTHRNWLSRIFSSNSETTSVKTIVGLSHNK